MRLKLTDITLKQFPHPESGQVRLQDADFPGFGCLIGKRTKTFFLIQGKSRQMQTIGRYPDISLKDARKEAKRLLGYTAPKKRLRSYSEACEDFYDHCHAKGIKQSTIDNYRFSLQAVKATTLANIPLNVTHPNHVKALKVFLNWCLDMEMIEKNPYGRRRVTYNQRERVLTDDEIRLVWAYEFPPYSDYLKILLLTGQRRNQFRNFSIQGDNFHFPDMKQGKPHLLPVLPMAAEIAERLQPFNGWSKAKTRLDRHVDIPHWTVHDLRRTHSTNQARIGTPIHVTEAILAHTSGTISGVARVYNRHSYLEESRVALAKYEAFIQTVLG